MPISLRQEVQQELQRMKKSGVISRVDQLPKVEDLLAQMSDAKVFTKLVANAGFWQIPLVEKSILLTTFITPFG